jgi:TatD DNase family protein
MKLIDIGVNLTDKSFKNDSDQVVDNAITAGVSKIIITGTTEEHSKQALALANKRPEVLYATAGVHPHHAGDINDKTMGHLDELAKQPQVVAIGECGLDYNRNFSPREQQLRGYEMQLELAVECKLPVFLHQRDAHEDFIKILSRYRQELSGGVVHCFTGNREELNACLELDMHIGITGWICDERRGKELQEIVSDIPLQRLMIETDAPYLLPRSLRPKPKSNRNEPKYLPHVCATVAACMGKTEQQIADASTEAAHRLFGL